MNCWRRCPLSIVWERNSQVFTMTASGREETADWVWWVGQVLVCWIFHLGILIQTWSHTIWTKKKKQFASVCSCKEKREDKSSDDSGYLNHFLINYLSGYFRGKCFSGIWIIHIFVKCDNAFIFNAMVHNTGRHREYKLIIKTRSLVIRKLTRHIINGLGMGWPFVLISMLFTLWLLSCFIRYKRCCLSLIQMYVAVVEGKGNKQNVLFGVLRLKSQYH